MLILNFGQVEVCLLERSEFKNKQMLLFCLSKRIKKKGSKLLITSATISAAFPFGHLIIGTVPVEIKKLYGPFLDEDNKNKNSHAFHMETF